jgi:SagB-type dehydrogenase family enzyme
MIQLLPFLRALNIRYILVLTILLTFIINTGGGLFGSKTMANSEKETIIVKFKPPVSLSGKDLQALLEKRYSCRDFQNKKLSLDNLGDILWATCGKKYDAVTGATRTIPSAGATYPLELFAVVGRDGVESLKEGVYRYLIDEHSLKLVQPGDKREELCRACLSQDFITQAPVSLVISAKFQRTTNRYGERGVRYVYIEAGHGCQNTYLAATNLGLAAVEVGAFNDRDVKSVVGMDKDFQPLVVMAVGYPMKWEK